MSLQTGLQLTQPHTHTRERSKHTYCRGVLSSSLLLHKSIEFNYLQWLNGEITSNTITIICNLYCHTKVYVHTSSTHTYATLRTCVPRHTAYVCTTSHCVRAYHVTLRTCVPRHTAYVRTTSHCVRAYHVTLRTCVPRHIAYVRTTSHCIRAYNVALRTCVPRHTAYVRTTSLCVRAYHVTLCTCVPRHIAHVRTTSHCIRAYHVILHTCVPRHIAYVHTTSHCVCAYHVTLRTCVPRHTAYVRTTSHCIRAYQVSDSAAVGCRSTVCTRDGWLLLLLLLRQCLEVATGGDLQGGGGRDQALEATMDYKIKYKQHSVLFHKQLQVCLYSFDISTRHRQVEKDFTAVSTQKPPLLHAFHPTRPITTKGTLLFPQISTFTPSCTPSHSFVSITRRSSYSSLPLYAIQSNYRESLVMTKVMLTHIRSWYGRRIVTLFK